MTNGWDGASQGLEFLTLVLDYIESSGRMPALKTSHCYTKYRMKDYSIECM